MKARLAVRRWNGVGRASVAVAGVCLTGSVASAWTTTRAADFETEFEGGQALGTSAAPVVAGDAAAVNAVARVVAADSGSTVWEQTLVGYLDKLVARECDEADKDAAKQPEVAAAAPQEAAQQDVVDAVEIIVASAPAAEASEPKADANPDWDLEEPAVAVAAIDPDWDLAEAPVAVADAGPNDGDDTAAEVAAEPGTEVTAQPIAAVDADWDLEDGPVAVAEVNADWDLEEPTAVAVAAVTDADWDLAEGPAVATAANADWDLDEPAPGEAVAATARESADSSTDSVADPNPDWDIDEPTIAAASADEVTKVDSADDEFDLIP
jgi:hypothetical protein